MTNLVGFRKCRFCWHPVRKAEVIIDVKCHPDYADSFILADTSKVIIHDLTLLSDSMADVTQGLEKMADVFGFPRTHQSVPVHLPPAPTVEGILAKAKRLSRGEEWSEVRRSP